MNVRQSGCKLTGAAFVGRRVRVLWRDERMHNGTICQVHMLCYSVLYYIILCMKHHTLQKIWHAMLFLNMYNGLCIISLAIPVVCLAR